MDEMEELDVDDDKQAGVGGEEAGARGDNLLYATPQHLLDLWNRDRAGLMRWIKQALDHMHETGRLRPADLQLPIRLSPFDTAISPLLGYEGGEFDPERLGTACILIPPTEGRGSNAKGAYRLNCVGEKEETSEPGLDQVRMFPKARKSKSAPKLLGTYCMYKLKAPLDVLVPDPDAAPHSDPAPAATSSNREPYVLMHTPKPDAHVPNAHVVVPEPTTAVDVAYTPQDARPTGTFGAASEITPDESLEQVTGLVEHLSLPEAGALPPVDAPSPGPPDQVTGLTFSASPAVAAGAASCAHCGEQGVELKRCSICKQIWYCGAQCQKKGWRGHKKTCAPPLPLQGVWDQVLAADEVGDWGGVLKWEGRMEELLAHQPDAFRNSILLVFMEAHRKEMFKYKRSDHALDVVRLEKRRVVVLGTMKRFRDQGEALSMIADALLYVSKEQEAASYFERARKVGEAHGFFSVKFRACLGLGQLAGREGRTQEGLELLRHALAAADFCETDKDEAELSALRGLIDLLLKSRWRSRGQTPLQGVVAGPNSISFEDALDELQPLVPRFLAAAKADTQRMGLPSPMELYAAHFSTRFLEARGKRHETVREFRTLLDLVRENLASEQNMDVCEEVLRAARGCQPDVSRLELLDPELGDKELIASVEVAMFKLFMKTAGKDKCSEMQ